jgi:hypothetical protein
VKDFWKTKYNILEAIRRTVAAWKEVSVHFLNTAWKPLQPAIQQDFEGFEDLSVVETGLHGESMGLEKNKGAHH